MMPPTPPVPKSRRSADQHYTHKITYSFRCVELACPGRCVWACAATDWILCQERLRNGRLGRADSLFQLSTQTAEMPANSHESCVLLSGK